MSDAPVGREPIQIVEILQPFCENVFGVSPCTATGTADTKCYNTRATCQDPSNFALGAPLSLFFTKAQMLPTLQANQRVSSSLPSDWILADGTWEDGGIWYDSSFWKDENNSEPRIEYDAANSSYPSYVLPSLVSVSTSPTKVNLAGASSNAKGLGNRALCTIRFKDHQHTDRLVDPYVDGRSWNPLSRERGSFWARWLVRNKYRTNIQVKVYEGYAGQSMSEMRQRLYVMSSVSKQNSSGDITMECKDVLARLEERQAQVPAASAGVLFTDITEMDTSFEVANAVEADYDASGTLRIGDEVMTYAARATSANGIEFTGVTRGTDNTEADDHKVDAAVQLCLRYTEEELVDVLIDLMQTRGGLSASYMADFVTGEPSYEEALNYLSFARVTRLLTEPYGIGELIADLAEQLQFFIWWEETEQLVKLRAIRGFDVLPDTLTDKSHIISGTFSMADKPKERASQVWVYYAQRDPTENDTNVNNYASQYVIANLESETGELYGSASIRKIFGAWINTGVIAQTTATKLSNKYVDTPTQGKFRVDIKDGDYQIGATFYISHYLDVDQYGSRRLRAWTVVSREEVVPNEIVEYVVEDTSLYGRVYFVMAGGSGDYNPSNVPFKSAYIGNADGLLSDGTEAARIG